MKTMYQHARSFEEVKNTIAEKPAVLLYFSHDDCSVCKVLKPKIAELLEKSFPLMEMLYVNVHELPEVAGQYRVFAVPTVLIFFDGSESFRFSRNLSTTELAEKIKRPYDLMFTE